ncbi:putative reverse transcriptase zinc-binding domain-containing protein [Helianthus annuus]|nr:putative reverse transcriptase zinc-binding domain-containing protein [Helianthus annuus]KAJ0472451.1 putative reverse transcriptase zinc-binding domain-containing protein [Helianthus annuus]KAJ0648052.1 putative reverse transcriptase zinc-binding domain-containing protein [Helianthus annuus]
MMIIIEMSTPLWYRSERRVYDGDERLKMATILVVVADGGAQPPTAVCVSVRQDPFDVLILTMTTDDIGDTTVWRRRWCKSGLGSGAWVSLGHVTFQFRVVRFKPVADNGSSQIHVSVSSFGLGRGQTGFTSIRQVRGSGQLVNGSVKDGQNQSTHDPEYHSCTLANARFWNDTTESRYDSFAREYQGFETRLNWHWRSDISDAESLANLNLLSDALSSVQILADMDCWKWGADREVIFSVNSVKSLLKVEANTDNSFVLDWCKRVPAKVNIHAWRSEMDKIPTVEALRKRNINIGDPICPLCNSEEETSDHVFNACFVAANVWNGINSWCKISNIFAFSIKDLLTLYKDINGSEKKKEAVQGIILIGMWSIWHARNSVKFSNAFVRIDSIISEIKALSFLWYSCRSKHKGVVWKDWVSFVNM